MDCRGKESIFEGDNKVKEGAAEVGCVYGPVESSKGEALLESCPHGIRFIICEVPNSKDVINKTAVEE